jgi:multiple sugar transport system substrate-binding protein
MANSPTNYPSFYDRRGFLKATAGAGAFIPAVGLLDACSNKKGGSIGGDNGSSSGKVTNLTVPVNKSPWLDAYKQIASEYQKKSGVTITLREFPYDGLRTKMVNQIQGGSHTFDVFMLDEPWTGEFYDKDWCEPFINIDSSFSMNSNIIDYSNLPYWDSSKRTHAKSGKVMGLPLNGNVAVFVYRKDLYSKLGLTVPKTFEHALSNGRKAQKSGKSEYGYAARAEATKNGQSITYDFMPLLYTYGGGFFDKKWNPKINNQGSIAAMQMFIKLLELGPKHPQTVGQADVIAAMQSGETLQIHTVAAAMHQIVDPAKSKVADNVGFAEIPAGGTTRKPAPTSGVWSLAIPKNLPKKRQKAALEFITWLLSKQAQLKFTKQGGLPTRKDTYDANGLPSKAKPYLSAVQDSLSNIHPSVRYTFAANMLPVTETTLSSIAAGKTPVKKGLDDLADKYKKIAHKAGYGS